jgi:REP element-mobilizing transposase RayT
MARLLRRDLPDGLFHVTSHGICDAPIFRVDVDRVDFLSLLSMVADQFGWAVHGYCLLGTHYHLVVETTTANLSAGMQRLNGRYAQLFNQRHRRRGHLFEGRFHSWVVRDERHFEATCIYVAENPVRAQLCATAADWPWSEIAVVRQQHGEPLVRAEVRDRSRQPSRGVRDVTAEEEPAAAAAATQEQRDVTGCVAGSRHDEQPPVTGYVERTGKRADGRSGEVNERGLDQGPALGEVAAQPP